MAAPGMVRPCPISKRVMFVSKTGLSRKASPTSRNPRSGHTRSSTASTTRRQQGIPERLQGGSTLEHPRRRKGLQAHHVYKLNISSEEAGSLVIPTGSIITTCPPILSNICSREKVWLCHRSDKRHGYAAARAISFK